MATPTAVIVPKGYEGSVLEAGFETLGLIAANVTVLEARPIASPGVNDVMRSFSSLVQLWPPFVVR